MKHELKILDTYFDAVDSGIKPFEVRNNDRNFQVGDMILLKEGYHKNIYDEDGECDGETWEYTGRTCVRYITYILPLYYFGFGKNASNYVVLGLKE